MKAFVAIEAARPSRGRYTFSIYKVFPAGLSYLGESSLRYGATRGPESEVFNWLVDNAHLPKSARADKKGGNYFIQSYQPNIRIQYIIPRNQA